MAASESRWERSYIGHVYRDRCDRAILVEEAIRRNVTQGELLDGLESKDEISHDK